MNTESAYRQLTQRFRETRLLDSIAGVLGWDERTYMPPKGAGHRAEQMALLARLGHERLTDRRLGELLGMLEASAENGDFHSPQAVNVREIRRLYEIAVKVPATLVEELARTTTRAQGVWQEARAKNDLASFAPWLDKIIHLKRQEAHAIGFRGAPYDALLDQYEPGATTAAIATMFAELRRELVPLIGAIADSGRTPRADLFERDYPIERQHLFGQAAAAAIGFDFNAGRLDTTAHPFCSGIGPGDCRLTTRYHARQWNQGFFGILHESGHGIYEQGLDAEHFGMPAGMAASLGVHESQSRLWENQVGRSGPFWEHFFPRAKQMFPGTLDDVTLDDFMFAINKVASSFIRVEADEATYNLHIILRFELEQSLLAGELNASDVPAAWNEKFAQFFGVTPSSAADGCLQDIHWSMGGLGYFPTYALGNLYAAQLMARAREELSDLDADFRMGRFIRLKSWLNQNVHQPGQTYRSRELMQRITGKPPSCAPLMEYLRKKYGALYGISGVN